MYSVPSNFGLQTEQMFHRVIQSVASNAFELILLSHLFLLAVSRGSHGRFSMAHPVHLAKFEAVSASLNAASPLRALFMRIATHDTSMTSLDFTAALQQEFIRWPEPRQVAALALLIGNPYVTVINLSGLTLPDAGASALAAALHADAGGRVEVLNLERNDLREPGLLNIVGALQSNTTLRELRLTDQRTAVSTAVEMALAEMLDKGGRPHPVLRSR